VDGADEVRLDEGDVAAGLDQQLRQGLGVEPAALGEHLAALDGEALEPGLDGDAAGGAEQLQQARLPQSMRVWTPKRTGRSTRASRRAVWGRKISSMK
jgi:hypothetical protein